MNKFYIVLFITIIFTFLGIFFVNQKDSLFNSAEKSTPVLPTGSDILRIITPETQSLKNQEIADKQQSVEAASVVKQEAANPTFGVAEEVKASYSAVIKTSKGDIELTLYGAEAPRTVVNFIKKAQSNYYNGLIFHRVEHWVIQGGDPKGDGTGGGYIATELNTHPFIEGSLGVARGSDIRISNDSQFFITKSPAPWLNQQYTNFGIVTKGMDIVNAVTAGDKIQGITIN